MNFLNSDEGKEKTVEIFTGQFIDQSNEKNAIRQYGIDCYYMPLIEEGWQEKHSLFQTPVLRLSQATNRPRLSSCSY